MKLIPVEPGNRIQLPAEWAELLQLRGVVAVEKTPDGILIRPVPPVTWKEFFATKLTIGSAPPDANEDAVEVTGDDYLF
jgi:hypothetical protein